MRDSGWTRSALAVLGVAGVLAVSACGDGTTPEPSASGSSTPAPQSSSAPPEPQKATPERPAQNLVPPELPEEATEFTEEGFKAFIEYWVQARNYGIATGDGSYVQSVSDEDCPGCNTALKQIENVANGGGDVWIVGGEMEATDIIAKIHGGPSQTQRARFTLRQFSGDAYDADGLLEGGQDVHRDAVEAFEFEASYQNGGWTAARIEVRS